ncbi:GntR family transcriptional regulator, partial [Halalkalibacterium halodurans]|uniref:GntR family transcriptional regulator n=1 Tax=Halalkalibacterium halodurans TaxID=86665 RepID=UPI002E248755|nr:GntR family transcriptional regulator [Halalkalibacterium halodurans]
MNELNVKKRPLYKQLKQELIQKIERGELKPGDVLPPERELAKIFNMSRMTVRQA